MDRGHIVLERWRWFFEANRGKLDRAGGVASFLERSDQRLGVTRSVPAAGYDEDVRFRHSAGQCTYQVGLEGSRATVP